MFWLKSKFIGLVKLWFLLGIFILPFVFWPWAAVPYEIPKVWFFQRWVEGLGVLGVMGVLGGERGKEGNKGKKGEMFLVLGVLGFVLVAVISSLLGVDLRKSLVGNYYRQDGLLTLFHLAGLFFFLNLFWEKSWQEPLVKTLAISSMILSFWTIFLGVRYWGNWGNWGDWGKWGGMVFGKGIGATFGNPNFLAGYLLVTLPFTIWGMRDLRPASPRFASRSRGGVLRVLGVIGQIGAVFLTGSRAGILGVLGLGVFWGWGKVRPTSLGIKRLGILVLLGLLGMLGVLGEMRGMKEKGFVAESRGRIWQKGISAFLKRPILGWGWANFDYAFESSDWPMKFNQDVYVDKAHSSLLEVLVCGGIEGVGVYGGMILLRLRGLLKDFKGDLNWRKVLLFAFLLFLFHSQTNVISVSEEVIFWLILGVV